MTDQQWRKDYLKLKAKTVRDKSWCYKCAICSATFVFKFQLYEHAKTHRAI